MLEMTQNTLEVDVDDVDDASTVLGPGSGSVVAITSLDIVSNYPGISEDRRFDVVEIDNAWPGPEPGA